MRIYIKTILTFCSLLSALSIFCVTYCRAFVVGVLASFPLVHGFRSLLVENTVFGSCVYYDVQTVCKQLSVYKWMESRAKFPLRHSFSPQSPAQEVIPSTSLQHLCFYLFFFLFWISQYLQNTSGLSTLSGGFLVVLAAINIKTNA